MARIVTQKASLSGIALGGIGAGSVELMPDGEFHYWQIANPPRLTRVCFEDEVDDGEGSAGALSFYIRTETDGQAARPVVRKLGLRTDPRDFTYRMYAWNKPVRQIEFDGRFPVCRLGYIDEALPVRVTATAVAPFVPHHSDIAATPGFYIDFDIENVSDRAVTASLLSTLVPSFMSGGECVGSARRVGQGVRVTLRSEAMTDAPNAGSVCLSVGGDGENSFITADYRRYIREYVHHSAFGVSQESVLFAFRERGRLPDSEPGTRPPQIPESLDEMTDQALDQLIGAYAAYPFAASILQRVRDIDPAFPCRRADKVALLAALRDTVGQIGADGFGSTALCGRVRLAPGERKRVSFVLTWHFPNQTAPDGRTIGHYYENLYADAAEANDRLTRDRRDIRDRAEAFSDLLYATDLPGEYPDCWSAHLSTLVKSSCYIKDGRFGLWEGQGYCGFHTTDITYHASFGLAALFPDLQMKQMLMGAAFQREDGRVHHCFEPGFDQVDGGFDRVDMNSQFVLMVLRDYMLTGERAYLDALWPHVVRAMDAIAALDADGDGLPDRDTKRNTYDAWNMSGTPAYIAVLWLAALKAAAIMAGEVGDAARADHWRATLDKGLGALEDRLWNGEYYDLWRDEARRDQCLMTDQLDGEWFLRAAGLEGNLPDERVRAVMRFIFDHNFDPDDGLFNASCPDGKSTTLSTHRNCQAEAVWTGVGYAMASLCLRVGLRDQADAIVRAIHFNQARLGALWDHWECGHHYTRPLSSWTTLTAALGLSVDAPRKRVTLRPILDDVTLPLCLPAALALARFEGGRCRVRVVQGSLAGWTVTVQPRDGAPQPAEIE